jgi:hypothetical protein
MLEARDGDATDTVRRVSGADELGEDRMFAVTVDGDSGSQVVLERYWAGAIDASGRPVFDESVSAIADDLGIPASEVTRLAKATGFAQRADWTCPGCGDLWVLRTRSESKPSGPRSRCTTCRAAEEVAVQEQMEAVADRDARRQELVSATYQRGDTNEPAQADLPDLGEVAMSDLVSFYTWLLHTGPDGILVPAHEHDLVIFAGPDVESRVHRAGLVRIDPSTSSGAFVWDEHPVESDGLPPKFWPSRARFHVPGSGPLAGRVSRAIGQVEASLGDGWPNSRASETIELVRSLLAAEGLRYLSHQIERHLLPAPDLEQRSKFLHLAEDALTTYSLGQCYTLLWRSAKDAAAARTRNSMPGAKATAHAINQFGTNAKRFRSKASDLHEYEQPWDIAFAAETQILLTAVLALDPMTARPNDIEKAARDRLSDDETIARFIARGLPKDRASAAILRLAETPRFGDQVDPLIDGLIATVGQVLEHGGSESDAIRTAYFSLDLIRATGAFGTFEIEEAEITIRAAITGATGR